MRNILLFCVLLLGACLGDGVQAQQYPESEMQKLAATAADLGRAVRRYALDYPDRASTMDDRQLVIAATAHDPSLLQPYQAYVVRGTPAGIILVCDGTRGLIEDAVCSDKVDDMRWGKPGPCAFQVDLATACGR